LEVSVHVSGYPPLFRGEWELRLNDISGFYMNYNLYPQDIPWRDSISHAVKYFKGTEYTISKPRDLWFATSEMVNRIARSKHLKTSSAFGAR
jgi:hypothetical protein